MTVNDGGVRSAADNFDWVDQFEAYCFTGVVGLEQLQLQPQRRPRCMPGESVLGWLYRIST